METLKDFFSQIPNILKFGILGLSVIMLIILAYVAIKQPDRKFPIVIITVFCAFVLVFFTVSGIGLQNENNEIKTVNKTLEVSKDSLVRKNDILMTDIKIADTRLKSTEIISDLNNKLLPHDSIADKVSSLASHLNMLEKSGLFSDEAKVDNIKNNYKDLAAKVKVSKSLSQKDKLNLINNNKAAKEIIFAY
jgi:hypothetical protein